MKGKRTRRREFLEEMERVMRWSNLVALVWPYLPEGKRGRPPFALEAMLRIHFMQQWFNLSDPAMEEALHDMPLFREFAGLEGWGDRLPDGSAIPRFRHELEQHELALQILQTVNALLQAEGLQLKSGTMVDATLIAAPSSAKNASGERGPEMHHSKKCQQWYFGAEARIGVDAESGPVHTVQGTAGNVNDVLEAKALLHGQEISAYGDAGYQGATSVRMPGAHCALAHCHAPGQAPSAGHNDEVDRLSHQIEKIKASIRAKVEHPFRVLQAPVWSCESALSGLGQEHGTAAHIVRAGEPGAPKVDDKAA